MLEMIGEERALSCARNKKRAHA